MIAIHWPANARKLDCHRDLEIKKPVEHGDVDVLIGSDYYEKLLLPPEHHIGKPREPVGVKTPLGRTIARHVWEVVNECHIATHVYAFHATFTPEMRAD